MKSTAKFSVAMLIVGVLCVSDSFGNAVSQVTVDDYEARVFTSSQGDTLPYRLFIPRDYNPDIQYPLVLFHHGGGATGDDNRRNLEGPCPREWAAPTKQAKNPCFIVAPQIPGKESAKMKIEAGQSGTDIMKVHIRTIHELLDSLEAEFSIDTSREYVTGLSMGGECTWMSIIERPDRFAAAVPICAGDKFIGMDASERGRKFAHFPLWIFHGDADEVISVDVSREVVKALRDAGGNPKYTEYPGVDHGSWVKAYRDPELIEWLFAQSRETTLPPRTLPEPEESARIPAAAFASSRVGNVSAQTYSYSDLVARLSDLQYLATPPAVGEKGGSFSSWDRGAKYNETTGKYDTWWSNGDGGGFMDSEGTMAEIDGPGVIWRIWSANPEPGGNFEIYIDGAEEPTLSKPFLDMFNNRKPPFDYPELVRMLARGQNFYIPIPFQKSIRIRGTEEWGDYYQISYTTFPKTTTVPSFTGTFSESDRAALKKANNQWARRGPQTYISPNDKVKEVTVRLKPGEEKVLGSYDKPGAITSLTMDRPDMTWEESLDVLRELTISMTWDNDAKPAVWSPIGDFFGTGAGENLFKSLTMGMTEDKYYSNWYMPFSKAKVMLRNDGDQPRGLTFTIHTAKVKGDVNDLLRFHCKWHRDDYSGLDKQRFSKDRWPDWPILKTSKTAGRFCGFQLHIWNPLHLWNKELKGKYQGGAPEGDFFAPGTAARALFDHEVSQHYWWGEGDEKFFVDGEKMPSTFGTGSEDYFGYAWGTAEKFESGLQCQTRNHENVGHIAVVRCQTADNVPFHDSFEATIEKYHGNNWPLLYATTARWYQTPATEGPYREVPLKKRVKYYVQPKPKPN